MPISIDCPPSRWRLRLHFSMVAASVVAAVIAFVASVDWGDGKPKIASRPSPMNLSITPPLAVIACSASERNELRSDATCDGSIASETAVNPPEGGKRHQPLWRKPVPRFCARLGQYYRASRP